MSDIVKHCRITNKKFVVTEWEQNLLGQMEVPLPTLCIEQRHRRRLSYRNERKIYKRSCDLSGQSIISMYSEDKPFKVYEPEAWWGDGWDGRDHARDFDFSRPFFEQFCELRQNVPRLALVNVKGENSDYCLNTLSNKNCYLVFGGDNNEDCRYTTLNMYCKDTADVYWVNHSQLAYECVDCDHCYELAYSQNCSSCSHSSFLYECRRCENCIACVGLIAKKYHIFNEEYSPEDYHQKAKELRLDTWSGVQRLRGEFDRYKLNFPHRFAHIVQCEDVTGDYLSNAKNCKNCFTIEGPAEDIKDCIFAGWDNSKDILSCNNVGIKAEMYYEMVYCNSGRNCAYCLYAWSTNDSRYCESVMHSHDMFGCVGLKKSEYCIFNKPYSKTDYFALKDKIIDHMKETEEWGEYFPMHLSPFAYNESGAQDFFPITEEQASVEGLQWKKEERREIGSTPPPPDSIVEVDDGVVDSLLVCEQTGRPYRIIPQELKFYRDLNIPIPRLAPDTRHELRLNKRNGIQAWERNCARCDASIVTTYSTERAEEVVCEQCFEKFLYG